MTGSMNPPHGKGGAIRIELPWPDHRLSPNARLHWAEKARAVKQARSMSAWEAVANRSLERCKGAERLSVGVTFNPPDERRRDTDNMLASIKPYLDGIVDVVGVDDSRWAISLQRSEPVKGGRVVVEIEVAA